MPRHVLRSLGEEQPADFFRQMVEPLADSFDPVDVAAYERLMQVWIRPVPRSAPSVPKKVDTVYVLSRVTLGADIKITSVVLDAMKVRFPEARVILVGHRKSAELFSLDRRIEHLDAPYPRSGPVSQRIAFADQLREQLTAHDSIVVDPDSRISQLGLIPVCAPDRYFHFPSRSREGSDNLTRLTENWVHETFAARGERLHCPGTRAERHARTARRHQPRRGRE